MVTWSALQAALTGTSHYASGLLSAEEIASARWHKKISERHFA
jgi:hypothetical protein